VNVLEKIGSADPKVYRLIFAIAILIPMIVPLGLPISIDAPTQNFYNIVSKLQPGDFVCISYDFSSGGAADLLPQTVQVVQDAFAKKTRVVFVAFVPDGRKYIDQAIASFKTRSIQAGVDYVNLGYIAGLESGVAAFMQDIKRTTPVDTRGVAITSIDAYKQLSSANDFKLVITFNNGSPDPPTWVRQMARYKDVPLMVGSNATMFPTCQPFIAAGQLKGALNGSVGAAGYEKLAGRPDQATGEMDVQSIGHALFLLFIVAGNIVYFGTKPKGRK
jgi:hypothetical protein